MLLTVPQEEHGLLSPMRQIYFMLGLFLTTKERTRSRHFGRQEWDDAVELTNSIFNDYAWMYFPQHDDKEAITTKWRLTREVAMSAFIHYFSSGLMASSEQIEQRIEKYLRPFDDEVSAEIGISSGNSLSVAKWILKELIASLDELGSISSKEESARHALLNTAEVLGWNLEEMRKVALTSEYKTLMDEVFSSLRRQLKIRFEDLRSKFGDEMSSKFLGLFSTRRGEVSDFTYLTERNPAEYKPIIDLGDGSGMVTSYHTLLAAILKVGEEALLRCGRRESYLKKRDQILEDEVTEAAGRLFGSECRKVSGAYESDSLQHEHDLVLIWRDKLFVFEAKASPPVEPFRDPERAYERISRHFASSQGIQKAFEQANRIRRMWKAGQRIRLFDKRRKCILDVSSDAISDVYCVCVSRDNYGPLATDLTLLLEKDKDDQFPWAVNIVDFINVVDAWGYFKWGPERLCDYLDDRLALHGRISTDDELDIVGFFIEHGSLWYIQEADAGRVFLNPTYSEVFEKLFRARHGGPAVEYEPHAPHFSELSLDSLARAAQERGSGQKKRVTSRQQPIRRVGRKVGRNEPCPCGSGKKFKRCCGSE